MDLFHRIDDAQAIVRIKGGVFKQVELYRRGPHVYAKAQGGYVQIKSKWDETWGTTSPSVTVVDMPKSVVLEYKL